MKSQLERLTSLFQSEPDYLPYLPAIDNLIQVTSKRPYTANPIIEQTHSILNELFEQKQVVHSQHIVISLIDVLLMQLSSKQDIERYMQRYQNENEMIPRLRYGLTVLSWYNVIDSQYRYIAL